MITPTVGRVVWVHRKEGSFDVTQPEVGLILYVHDERHINVEGWSATGHPFVLIKCPLRQDNDTMPDGDFAMWMPYQLGQAAKTEELQKAANAQGPVPGATPGAIPSGVAGSAPIQGPTAVDTPPAAA